MMPLTAPTLEATSSGARLPEPVGEGKPTQMLRGTRASDHLDMIRGVAAMAVLYRHARVLLIQSVNPHHDFLIARLLYVLSDYGFGRAAVMVFFVLSGYLISRGIIRDIRVGRWSWQSYLVARGTRLYLVLIPALVLTAALDPIGLHMVAKFPGKGDSTAEFFPSGVIRERDGPVTFLGNLAFLQTICVQSYGSNGALWSLANEFWYYLIFPCLWLAWRGPGGAWRRTGHGCAAILLLVLVGWNIAAYFGVWLFGAALAIIPPPRSATSFFKKVIAFVPLVGVLGLMGLGKIQGDARISYAVGITFALFLYTVLHDRLPSRDDGYARMARRLSGCSYSVYLTHYTFLVLVRARFTYQHAWPADASHWLLVGLVCLIGLLFGYALSLVTEAHTDSVRRWIAQRIRRWAPAAPAQ